MTVAVSCQFWQDTATRLRLALRVLAGRAVMYRVKILGTVTIAADREMMVAECEFKGDID